MQPRFATQQNILGFDVLGVGYATIDGTNRRALRLFMKTDTFGTFIGHDVIKIVGNRHLRGSGIDHDAMKRKLVNALYGLCTDLGIMVVAEGVETPAERDALVKIGCNYLQGYLFARPAGPFPEAQF